MEVTMAGLSRESGRRRTSPGKDTTQRDGIITGYVLKLARESAGLTQAALAEALELDTQTVQSWESGRRPLTATNVRDFVRLRLLLFNLQVSPILIDAMDEAAAADYILSYILHADPEQVDC